MNYVCYLVLRPGTKAASELFTLIAVQNKALAILHTACKITSNDVYVYVYFLLHLALFSVFHMCHFSLVYPR